MKRKIKIYFHPFPLTSDDVLTDGPFQISETPPFKLESNTLLTWIDLVPEAKFTHPTAYILISANNTRVEKGGWWPVLNGQKILYGQSKPVSITSPFELNTRGTDIEALLSTATEVGEAFISYGTFRKISSVILVDLIKFIDLKKPENLPILNISVTGFVGSSGWTNPRLKPLNPGLEPKDGIKEFDFLADPPCGIADRTQNLITAVYQCHEDFLKWKGVRIHTQTNSVFREFGEPLNYMELGHVVKDTGELPHGNKWTLGRAVGTEE